MDHSCIPLTRKRRHLSLYPPSISFPSTGILRLIKRSIIYNHNFVFFRVLENMCSGSFVCKIPER